MNKLNVLFIPSWYPSVENPSEGIFFQHQVEALKRNGVNVGILLPPTINNYLNKKNIKRIFEIFKKPVIKKENHNGNPVYSISVNGITRLFWIKQMFFKYACNILFDLYLSENPRPDVIHAHSAIWGGIFSFHIKNKYKIPYVLTELISHYEENKIPSEMFPLLGKVFRNADSRIVVSPQLGQILEDKLGKVVSPWHWIPNIAEDYFFDYVNQNPVENNIKKFRFLNIGMMYEHDIKGHETLLPAFASKFADKNDVELVLIGDGPHKKYLEVLASKLKISKQVIFKGAVSNSNMASEISNCDVFVLSSIIETFGVVVVEALACGKPVVATKCGGPESIIMEANGILVPKSNPELLGEAMLNIKNNINNYIPGIIKEDCHKRFSSGIIAGKLIDIYRKNLSDDAVIN